MMHPTSVFVTILVVVRLSGVSSFAGVPRPAASSSSYHARHVSRSATSGTTLSLVTPREQSCLHTAADVATTPCTVSRVKPTVGGTQGSRPSRVRWHSRLGASGDNMGDATQAEESDATSGEGADSASSATATKASTAGGGGGAGVDLSKGIAFEAPKPKVLEPEQEEESDSKKIRVILYTVLSLVPFVLLLPFLGSRELMPLDPSQM